MFHGRQATHFSSLEELIGERALLPYAAGMCHYFALEGGGFLAFDAPATEFFRLTLPAHLDQQYFLSYLLALHQRFVLMSFTQQVAEHARDKDPNLSIEAFDRIERNFLEFTARGYFSAAMQRDHHHRVYARWQETFDLDRLYREVRDEITEINASLRRQSSLRLEARARRFDQVAAVLVVPAIVLAFLGINLRSITTGRGLNALDAALILAIALALGAVIFAVLSRSSRISLRRGPRRRRP
jgi:hypothetical protein